MNINLPRITSGGRTNRVIANARTVITDLASHAESRTTSIPEKIASILEHFGEKPTGRVLDDIGKIELIASTDALAGTKNKRAFMFDFQKILAKSKASGGPVSLALFDMDNFKAVNDLLGYTIGDHFITIIGQTVKRTATKHGAQTYRFGGEEFVVIFDKHDKRTAHKITTEIKDNLQKNKTLKQYTNRFIHSGKMLINEYRKKQRILMKLNNEAEKYMNLTRISRNYTMSVNKREIDPVLIEKIELAKRAAFRKFVAKISEILTKATKEASTQEDKAFLDGRLQRIKKMDITSYNRLSQVFDEKTRDYLDLEYNHTAKIAQIKKWVDSVAKIENGEAKGFTITAGLKEFKNGDKTPKECMDEVTELIHIGKKSRKGQVYTD